VNVTLDQALGALGLLGHIPGIGGRQLDVPLKLPTGHVGGSPDHTAVCS
jgi:hypothetical protein